ncbi:MAG: hypothetical protein HY730_05890 [Candidatus Tectomicrobia bacterium]|uniref:Uncharacterized protein n=1 Tax=Tectimicrobiota bacterium TaxID=2528274 RepID=A0A933GL60_UNCTE|nr:hypothetical protein [Candidatus Tectomicrobia bacterium]
MQKKILALAILILTLFTHVTVLGESQLKEGANSFIDYMQNHQSIAVLDFIKVFSRVYDYHVEPLRSRGELVFTENPMEINLPKIFGKEAKRVSGTFINQAKPVQLIKAGKRKNITIAIPETIKGYFIKSEDAVELIFDENNTLHISIFFFEVKVDKAEATRKHVKIGIANFPDITREF